MKRRPVRSSKQEPFPLHSTAANWPPPVSATTRCRSCSFRRWALMIRSQRRLASMILFLVVRARAGESLPTGPRRRRGGFSMPFLGATTALAISSEVSPRRRRGSRRGAAQAILQKEGEPGDQQVAGVVGGVVHFRKVLA